MYKVRTYYFHVTIPGYFLNQVDDKQAGGGKLIHVYSGNYWESKDKQDWSKCPDIF